MSKNLPSNKKSQVWEYYSSTENNTRVKCGICHTTLSYIQGSTTSMINHLKRKHDTHIAATTSSSTTTATENNNGNNHASTSSKQQKLDSFLQTKGGTKFPSSSPRAMKLTNNLVKMIFKDYQPLSIVEDDGFKSLMAEAEPRFCLPTRKSLRYTIIPAFYKKAATLVKEKVLLFKQKYGRHALFSVTTDGWTSNNTTSYIAYSLHIVDSEYDIASYVISLAELSSKHTAENLRSHICKTLQSWGVLPDDDDEGEQNFKSSKSLLITITSLDSFYYFCFLFSFGLVLFCYQQNYLYLSYLYRSHR